METISFGAARRARYFFCKNFLKGVEIRVLALYNLNNGNVVTAGYLIKEETKK